MQACRCIHDNAATPSFQNLAIAWNNMRPLHFSHPHPHPNQPLCKTRATMIMIGLDRGSSPSDIKSHCNGMSSGHWISALTRRSQSSHESPSVVVIPPRKSLPTRHNVITLLRLTTSTRAQCAPDEADFSTGLISPQAHSRGLRLHIVLHAKRKGSRA